MGIKGYNSGIRPPDLPECGRPGPESQLWPSHGIRVPEQKLSDGTLSLPWEKDAPPATSARLSDKDAGQKYIFWVAARRLEAG